MTSATTRLEAALLDAAEALLEVVGLPLNPVDPHGPRTPVSGSLICADEVPAAALRAAQLALEVLLIGAGVLDPEAPSCMSVEDGLAAMTRLGAAGLRAP